MKTIFKLLFAVNIRTSVEVERVEIVFFVQS
jgi:hypothetical protein